MGDLQSSLQKLLFCHVLIFDNVAIVVHASGHQVQPITLSNQNIYLKTKIIYFIGGIFNHPTGTERLFYEIFMLPESRVLRGRSNVGVTHSYTYLTKRVIPYFYRLFMKRTINVYLYVSTLTKNVSFLK